MVRLPRGAPPRSQSCAPHDGHNAANGEARAEHSTGFNATFDSQLDGRQSRKQPPSPKLRVSMPVTRNDGTCLLLRQRKHYRNRFSAPHSFATDSAPNSNCRSAWKREDNIHPPAKKGKKKKKGTSRSRVCLLTAAVCRCPF